MGSTLLPLLHASSRVESLQRKMYLSPDWFSCPTDPEQTTAPPTISTLNWYFPDDEFRREKKWVSSSLALFQQSTICWHSLLQRHFSGEKKLTTPTPKSNCMPRSFHWRQWWCIIFLWLHIVRHHVRLLYGTEQEDDAALPAQVELYISEFLIMADGRRSGIWRPRMNSFPTTYNVQTTSSPLAGDGSYQSSWLWIYL